MTTILYAISAMGSDGIGVYEALTDHSSSRIRKVSWQRYLNLSSGWNKPDLWLPAIKDRDKGVREAVLNMLRGRPLGLSADDMAKLVESKYEDVRIFAGQSLLTVNDSVMGEFSFDLLIDESSIVRSTTIRAMGPERRRVGQGYDEVLLDDDYVIQQAVMEALIEIGEGLCLAGIHFEKPAKQDKLTGQNGIEGEGYSHDFALHRVALLLVLCLFRGQQDWASGWRNSHHAIDEIGERLRRYLDALPSLLKMMNEQTNARFDTDPLFISSLTDERLLENPILARVTSSLTSSFPGRKRIPQALHGARWFCLS